MKEQRLSLTLSGILTFDALRPRRYASLAGTCESREIPEECKTSIRPRLGAEVPAATAQVVRASNPAGTTVMWVRDRLDSLWDDEDFAGWYPRDGRPGISPAQLASVSVLQFLLGLSDRDAAEAVRCRIDFKCTLGLDLDDPGFHHNVLGLSPDGRYLYVNESRIDAVGAFAVGAGGTLAELPGSPVPLPAGATPAGRAPGFF